MANALYDLGRQGFLDGSFNWASATVKCMLVSSAYVVNLGTHQFVADIPSGDIVARSAAFTGKTETAGVANAANLTYTAVSGAQINYLVIYEDTGSDATSRLIAYIDTASGLPVVPNGGDITVSWDTGTFKIFKL